MLSSNVCTLLCQINIIKIDEIIEKKKKKLKNLVNVCVALCKICIRLRDSSKKIQKRLTTFDVENIVKWIFHHFIMYVQVYAHHK